MMKRIPAVFLVPLLCGFLFSCRTVNINESSYRIYLTPDAAISLLPPECVETPASMQQLIHGYHGKDTYTMQAVVQMDRKLFYVNALTSFGISLFELNYSDSGLSFKGAAGFPEETGLYILGDFQLCYYSVKYIEPLLSGAGFLFSETPEDDGWRRLVTDTNGNVIIDILRKGNTIDFHNYLRDYGYHIEEAEI